MFERDDFQDRLQKVLLVILLEFQSWRGLQRLSHSEEGKKRTSPLSSRPAVGTFNPNAIDSTDQRETCSQIPEASVVEVLLTLGFLAGPRADGRTIGRSWSQMSSAQGRGESATVAFSLWLWILTLRPGVGRQVMGREQRSRAGGWAEVQNPRQHR